MRKLDEIASKFLGAPYKALDDRAKKVALHIAEGKLLTDLIEKQTLRPENQLHAISPWYLPRSSGIE